MMRRFIDREGMHYDVVLGRESWGSLLALFVPVTGSAPVRQAVLEASAFDVATQELDNLDEAELQELLDRSNVKDEGQP